MSKKFLTLCLAILFGIAGLRAETVTSYVESFADVDPSISGFHPKGWLHYMYSSSYYRGTYKLVTDQADSPYLTCTQYNVYDAYRDCLVSPATTGKVTLDAKLTKTDSNSGLKFYKATVSASGSVTLGEQITPDVSPVLDTDEFKTFEFTSLQPGTRIAIWAHNGAFKNFTAEAADVVLAEALEISVTLSETSPAFTGTTASNRTLNLPEDGNYTITFRVTLSNKGEVDYDTDTDNYTISLRINSVNGEDVVTVPIKAESIAAGESVTDYYTFNLNGSSTNGKVTYYLLENVDGKSDYDYDTINNVISWHSEFLMQESATTTSSIYNVRNGSTYNFGSIQEPQEHTYYIHNTGTAPLTFSCEAADGFTVTFPQGTTVEAGKNVPVTFGITTDVFGPKTGALTFTTNDADVPTFTLNLAGNVLDPTVYYEDFSTGKLPVDMVAESNNWTFSSGYAQNSYATASRLITPKLAVSTSDIMLVKASRTSSYSTPTLKFYRSADRSNWELVADLGGQISSSYTNNSYVDLTFGEVEPGEWYFAIEGAYVRLGELYGFHRAEVEYDLIATGQTIPATGEVNTSMSAQMTVRNVGPVLGADTYTAVMYVDGNAVAKAEAVDIAPGASATFEFTYTPHAAGEALPVEIKLERKSDGTEICVSTPAEITIAEEIMHSEATIGTQSTFTGNRNFYTNSKYSWTDILYKADAIPFEAGSAITRIAFRGNATSSVQGKMTVWIENSDLTSLTNKWADPEAEPTLSYEEYEIPVVSNGDLIVFDLSAAPFEYTGGSLRIRAKGEWSKTAATNYFYDSSSSITCYYDYESYDAATPTLYSGQTPVAYVSIAADPIEVSGVIIGKEAQPVADAKVTVKSGNVEYYATSGENGQYNVLLMKALEGYSVNVVADGYLEYSAPLDISAVPVTHDVTLTEAKGLYIPVCAIPTTGTVNYAIKAVATVQNCDATVAGDYTVALYLDGEKVATADGVELAANNPSRTNPDSEAEFTLSYVPHADGEFEAYIAVEWTDAEGQPQEYRSTAVTLTVNPEVTEGYVTVGNATGTSSYTPMYAWMDFSQSETCYSAQQLALPQGAKILNLTYKGYFNPNFSYDTFEADVKVWLANSTEPLADGDIFNNENMTLAYEGTHEFVYTGSSSVHEALLDLALAEPFVYEGGYLYVMFETDAYSGKTMYFEVDNAGTSYYRTSTSGNPIATSMPVVGITFDNKAVYEGVVVESTIQSPVADAEVTLCNGDVKYAGTTDSFGRFKIEVAQPTLSYTVTVEHPDFFTYVEDVENLEELAFIVVDKAEYKGTVTDEASGEAIAGASVSLTSGDVVLEATTADDGSFAIVLLDKTLAYAVSVECDGYLPYTAAVDDLRAPAPIALTKAVYAGVVVDESDEQPIEGATVTLSGGEYELTATTDAEGKFSIDVIKPLLDYTVTVEHPDYISYTADVDDILEPAAIAMTRFTVTFAGKVVEAGELAEPLAVVGATLTLFNEENEVEYTATTDGDGRFEIVVDMPRLSYTVAIEHPDYESYTSAVADLAQEAEYALTKKEDGIEDITNDAIDLSQPIFDLEGRRVDESYRGVVIQNGKKYLN